MSAANALFALIIGVNGSPDPGDPTLAPLQYADDDAARYLDLFRALGARTTLVSRLDENTARLHPQAAAEAIAPRRAELERAVEGLGHDIAQAHAHGVRAVLYVVYAGHGRVVDSAPTLTLEDGPLAGKDLLGFVGRTRADEGHVIVDACHAYMLAFERGPGGARRPLRGFVEMEAAARAGNVGYLLASSASGESHEWAGFQAGIFSHEVRSGLYGAADADGDGRVTYGEIAAFIGRANEAVVNERFRPRMVARAPRDGDLLLDLRPRRARELRLEGKEAAAHYLLEDARGVRLLDFHGSAGVPVRIVRPALAGPLYLRRLSDGLERTVPPSDAPVELGQLAGEPPRSRARGAAHQAFSQLFTLAFDQQAVALFADRTRKVEAELAAEEARQSAGEARRRTRQRLGGVAIGAGVLAAGVGAAFTVAAHRLASGAGPQESQRDAVARNEGIARRNALGAGFLVGAAGAAAAGAALLLWPADRPPPLTLSLSPQAVAVDARWTF